MRGASTCTHVSPGHGWRGPSEPLLYPAVVGSRFVEATDRIETCVGQGGRIEVSHTISCGLHAR